jgi:hypothetical protein
MKCRDADNLLRRRKPLDEGSISVCTDTSSTSNFKYITLGLSQSAHQWDEARWVYVKWKVCHKVSRVELCLWVEEARKNRKVPCMQRTRWPRVPKFKNMPDMPDANGQGDMGGYGSPRPAFEKFTRWLSPYTSLHTAARYLLTAKTDTSKNFARSKLTFSDKRWCSSPLHARTALHRDRNYASSYSWLHDPAGLPAIPPIAQNPSFLLERTLIAPLN